MNCVLLFFIKHTMALNKIVCSKNRQVVIEEARQVGENFPKRN